MLGYRGKFRQRLGKERIFSAIPKFVDTSQSFEGFYGPTTAKIEHSECCLQVFVSEAGDLQLKFLFFTLVF